MRAQFPEFEPSRLRRMVDSRRKSVLETHPNVESLKRTLKKEGNEISLETLVKIVDNFPKRLKTCIDANGDHFE